MDKRRVPWNKNLSGELYSKYYPNGFRGHKKGTPSWNSGLTKETNEKIKCYSENSRRTKKRLYQEGKIKPWNKDKTGVYSEEHKEKIRQKLCGTKISKEIRQKISRATKGENNPMYGKTRELSPAWLGGKSFEPYTPDFNKHFKESVRDRDNYCCIECNKPQEELSYKLHVHHIDYDKLNSFKENCVSLCRPCHTKTNFNRKSWQIFYQNVLSERYGYKYTQDQKIILDFIGERA